MPISDPKISSLTGYELLLYHELIVKDQEVERTRTRSYVEYAMAFLKPDVLKQVLEERKVQEENNAQESRQIFEKQVADMFGKSLQSSG